MAGGYEASGNQFKSILGSELGDNSLIDPSWYDTWFPYTNQSKGTYQGRSTGTVRIRTPDIDVQFNENQKASYIAGLSEIVEKGYAGNEASTLTSAQQAEFNAAKLALNDVLGDPTITDSENQRVQEAVLGANSALAGGEAIELSEGGIFGNPLTAPALGAKTVRLAHQCFLLYNLEPFSKFHRQLLAGTSAAATGVSPPRTFYNQARGLGSRGLGTTTTGPAARRTNTIQTSGYFSKSKNTTRMYLVADDSTESSITNKLALKKHGDKIANMQSSEISQLIPRLRFFKVYREGDDKSVVEFEFSPTTKVGMGLSNKIDLDFLGATQEKFIRGDDVGLKSFDWEFVGSDPFTATREIAASINLTAQHFSAYVRKRTSTNVMQGSSTLSYINPGEYRFLDFVLQPDCRDIDQRNLNYKNFSPECYEIRVEVGYNGGGKTFGTFDSDGQFQEAVNCHKDILLLSPTDHKFEFNDDGSVDLTINLRGRLDALMNDKMMNVLLPYGGASAALMQVSISNIDQDQRDEIPLLKGNTSASISLEDAENAVKYVNNNKKNIDNADKIQENLELAISKMYVSNKQLFFAHIFDKLDTGGAVHTYTMTPAEKLTYTNWATDLSVSVLPAPVSLSLVQTGGLTSSKEAYSDPVDRTSDPLRPENFGELFARIVSPTQEALTQSIQEEIVEKDIGVRMVNTISYIFLGDLLAVVLDSITGEDTFEGGGITSATLTNLERVELAGQAGDGAGAGALGEVVRQYFSGEDVSSDRSDLLSAIGFKKTTPPPTVKNVLDNFRVILGNIDARLKATGKNQTINLAHIPISVPLFNEFMVENVLAKDSDNYPFFEFVNHLISSLVINTLGTKCFGGLIDTSTTTQTLMINSPENIEERPNIFAIQGVPEASVAIAQDMAGPNASPRPEDLETARVEAEDVAATDRARTGQSSYRTIDPAKVLPDNPILGNCREQQKDVFEYLFIGTQTIDPDSLNGEYDVDLRRGIYHIAFGADRGLVKTMKFAKTNQEFLPEAQFASEGGLLLNQLSNAFDVSIEMVGNNLFKIGQYLYIDSEALGAGPSWADFTTDYGPDESPASGADITSSRTRSYANIMGLGGYHLITEVANSISDNGVYTTTIKARWQDPGTRGDWPDAVLI